MIPSIPSIPDIPEAEKRLTSKRPPTRTIGGRQVPLDTDLPTSLGRPPKYALCEPYTFGMRLAEPVTDAGSIHKYRYPVAQEYTDAMQALLTFGIEWPAIPGAKEPFVPAGRESIKAKAEPTGVRMGWPMTGGMIDGFFEAIGPIVGRALHATAFGLPKGLAAKKGAIPNIGFFRPEDTPTAVGVLNYKEWQLRINPSLIEDICNEKQPSSRDGKFALLGATLYHEARHAQQFFWMLAMAMQFPGDFPRLPLLPELFRAIFRKDLPTVAEHTRIPEEPSALIAIKRLVAGYYYALLVTQIRNLEKQHNASDQLSEYQRELVECERHVAELLRHVGRNGRPIDYKILPDNKGYPIRPWEDDAFACDFVVSQMWFARALPEPDRCNRFYDLRDGERPDVSL